MAEANARAVTAARPALGARVRKGMRTFSRQAWLQAFVLAGMAFFLLFRYVPMFGILIAFKDYDVYKGLPGFFTGRWAGLQYFAEFFRDPICWRIIVNTLAMSGLKLVFVFPMPILLALVLNEVRNGPFKRVVQTVSYLPHFISWVVVSGMIFTLFNERTGVGYAVLRAAGILKSGASLLADAKSFLPVVVVSDVWKSMGWWAIIFLAAISGVDQEIYEAAIIDGAGRLQRIWFITLPSIMGTILIVLILSLGNIMGGGLEGSNFDQAYLLGNYSNSSVSEILQTYVLKMGIAQMRFSYATAVGLFQSLIALAMVFTSNAISRRLSGYGLF